MKGIINMIYKQQVTNVNKNTGKYVKQTSQSIYDVNICKPVSQLSRSRVQLTLIMINISSSLIK